MWTCLPRGHAPLRSRIFKTVEAFGLSAWTVYRPETRELSSCCAVLLHFDLALRGLLNHRASNSSSMNGHQLSVGKKISCRFSRVVDSMASSGSEPIFRSQAGEEEQDIKFTDNVTSTDQQGSVLEASLPNPSHSQRVSAPSSPQEKGSGLSKRARKKLLRLEKVREMKKMNKHQTDLPSEAGFGKEIYEETEYYFENGLRKVYPYYYTFSTYVKRRWIDRTVLDVFSKEFCADDTADYRRIIEEGRLTVNGHAVSPDRRLKDNELLCHRVHRHENPVVAGAIEVIADTEDVLVINKPASIPCHPCGRYRHNSVVFIVGKELGYYNLRNIYRLDRLTSGVLILGKTESRSKELERQVAQRLMKKTYVARVAGCFPEGQVEVEQPLACASPKLGLWHVQPGGKPSHTSFRRLAFNGHSSLVQCIPHTGRTHQIRVHLQFLGHPIVNDPFYNSDAWGPNGGKGGDYGSSLSEVLARLMARHNPRLWEEGENPMYRQRVAELAAPKSCLSTQTSSGQGTEAAAKQDCASKPTESGVETRQESPAVPYDSGPGSRGLEGPDRGQEPPVVERPSHSGSGEAEPPRKRPRVSDGQLQFPAFQPRKWIPDVECERCRIKYRDPTPAELVLYLHALSYEGPGWKYEAPLPAWADQDWSH